MAKKRKKRTEKKEKIDAVQNIQLNDNKDIIFDNDKDDDKIDENTQENEVSPFKVLSGEPNINLGGFDLSGLKNRLKNSAAVFAARNRRRRTRNNKERTSFSSENGGKNDLKNNKADDKSKRKSSKNKNKLPNNISKKYISIAAFVFVAVCLIWIFVHKNANQVYVGDKLVGTIKDKKITAEEIYNNAAAKIQTEKSVNVEINEEISIKPVHASKKETASSDYVLTEVCKNLTYQIEACQIVIDGKPFAIVENEEAANKLLDTFAAKFAGEGAEIVERSFIQNVKLEGKFVNTGEIETDESVINKLSSTTSQPQEYTVAYGDTLLQIAVNAEMSLEDLIDANPGLNENSVLQLGQKLKILVPVPVLSVRTVEQVKFTENFDADVIVIDNNEEYKTYEKVITEGKQGKREVTVNVIKLNGIEEEKTIAETKTLIEPVAKKVERGTLQTPPKKALGSFIYPVSGRLSSGFGSRWGENHMGIDLACSHGTPIYASDGGTVEFSGFNSGGYGNLIIINHGNGYKTYYAHNSKNVVSVGEMVYQGQLIGYVGSTGNSTGNHSHFEIRKNGTPENPLNYL